MTIIRNSRTKGESTRKGGEMFTGEVWIDAVHADKEVAMANVMSTPCARIHRHWHEKGNSSVCSLGLVGSAIKEASRSAYMLATRCGVRPERRTGMARIVGAT
jgi:hypothetical protein